MRRALLGLVLALLLAACGRDDVASDAGARAAESPSTSPAARLFEAEAQPPRETAAFLGLGFDAPVAALHFRDSTGFNHVVLSESAARDRVGVNGKHFLAHEDGQRSLVREVRDGVEGCESDALARIVPDSLEVRDDDRDGLGEVNFAYELNCSNDVSPANLKLLVIEGGEKYILRGQTVIEGLPHPSPPKPEPVAGAWPDGAYDRAVSRFDQFARQ